MAILLTILEIIYIVILKGGKNMDILKISSGSFKEEVIKSDKPVLIDFYADWCGPCKAMSSVIKEVAIEISENVKVLKVNVDEESELSSQYEISTIPTLILFKNGEAIKNIVGLRDKSEIVEFVNQNI